MMLITRHYGRYKEGYITQSIARVEDDEGEPLPPPGDDYRLLDAPPDWSAQPGWRLRWIGDGIAPEWEPPLLADLKASKTAEINTAKLQADRTSFMFSGKAIQADEHSMLQIQITHGGIIGRGGLRDGWPGVWKAMDNTYVAIPDLATWQAFYDAIEETGLAHFAHSQTLKAQLAAATTAEEVAAITWGSGPNELQGGA